MLFRSEEEEQVEYDTRGTLYPAAGNGAEGRGGGFRSGIQGRASFLRSTDGKQYPSILIDYNSIP